MCNQINHTQFETITIPASANLAGIPLGQGKCKAVKLLLNNYVLNTETATAVADAQRVAYYGDRTRQNAELPRNVNGLWSPVIFCEDLSDVYVRSNGVETHVQVMIYMDKGQREYRMNDDLR